MTIRTSKNGLNWTGWIGCSDPPPSEYIDPAHRVDCKVFNETGIIRADPVLDPPEMQFYRTRAFYLGNSGRFASHSLQYAASPAEVNNITGYGYWGPYCPDGNGGFIMCHKGHGYGKIHGPHMMEEWWVGTETQNGPENITGWKRPYKRFQAVAKNVWLMAQPVVYDNMHVWVADTGVYTLPLYRLAGMYAVANGMFSSRPFTVASSKFYINVDASWGPGLVTTGCDEGCAAYVMVEVLDMDNNVLSGYERDKCIILNTTGIQVPLVWQGAKALPQGKEIRLRFFFRETTIYAVGQF